MNQQPRGMGLIKHFNDLPEYVVAFEEVLGTLRAPLGCRQPLGASPALPYTPLVCGVLAVRM